MAYVITDLNDFEIQISDGFRDIVIWKQNIRFGAIVGNDLTLYWHNKAQTDTQYQLTIDWNDVTAPVVVSAADLQTKLEGFIVSGWGGGGSGISLSAGGVTVSNGTVVFSNANSVTFGMAGSTVTASVSSPAQSEYFFSNSNGVSFGTAGSTVTASHNGITSQSLQSINLTVSGNQTISGTSGQFNSNLLVSGMGIIDAGVSGNVIYISASESVQPVAFSALGGSSLFSTLNFRNSNGAVFTNNGGSVELIYTVPTVTNSSWTASAGTQSATVSQLVFSNSNGVSFGLNNGTITGSHNGITSQSIQTQNAVSVLGSTGDISFANSNGITFGGNASTITASHNGLTSQSNQAVSGSNGSFTFQTVTFGNLNGLSFYTSNGSLVASYTVPAGGTPALSGSNGSFTYNTATFGNLNGMSFYTSNGSMVGSYTVPTVTNSSWTVSDSATSGTVGRLAFTNLNGVTLSLSSGTGGLHTIVGSHNALTSQSNQALSGSNGSFTFQTATFGNLNGASFYTSNGSMVLSYTVPAAGGALSFSAGTTSNTFNSLVFSNSNGVSFGLNGSTVTASVDAAAGGDITLSMWPDRIPILAPAATLNSGTTGSTGGSLQITASYHIASIQIPHPVAFSNMYGVLINSATSAGTGSMTLGHGIGIYTLEANTRMSLISSFQWFMHVSQNSVTARTHRWFWGSNSTSNSSQISGNVSASFTNPSGANGRRIVFHQQNATLSAGQYYIASVYTAISTGANVYNALSQAIIDNVATGSAINSLIGEANVSRFVGWNGVFSSTSNRSALEVPIMPSTIHTSDITISATGNISNTYRMPYIILEKSIS